MAGPDSALLEAFLEPIKRKNPSLPEQNWRALLADVSALVEGEVLKAGSPSEVGLRARLKVLSTEELRAVEALLRSPPYKKYQEALAHKDVADGTTEALILAIQMSGSKIVQAAKSRGFTAE